MKTLFARKFLYLIDLLSAIYGFIISPVFKFEHLSKGFFVCVASELKPMFFTKFV